MSDELGTRVDGRTRLPLIAEITERPGNTRHAVIHERFKGTENLIADILINDVSSIAANRGRKRILISGEIRKGVTNPLDASRHEILDERVQRQPIGVVGDQVRRN